MNVARTAQTATKAQDSGGSALLLQRKCACGGAAVLSGECEECRTKRLLGQPLQTKLRINEPGDEYEQEADRVADQVMRMSDASAHTNASPSADAPLVQRRMTGGNSAGRGKAPPIVQDVLSSPGQPLDAATRAFFEPRFGHDFGRVRVHTDEKAAESARAVNAFAYTIGRNIVFDVGRYVPRMSEGRRLLAHELTHVLQQSAQAVPSLQRESYTWDDSACTLTASYSLGFAFISSQSSSWTTVREDQFMDEAKHQIENTFNANTLRIAPNVASYENVFVGVDVYTTNCPCHAGGLAPRIAVSTYRRPINARSDDWNAIVSSNPTGEYRRSGVAEELGHLDEADIQREAGQVAVVHEFGHTIGLHHPGRGVAGIADQYRHTGLDIQGRNVAETDLMGVGMGLRPFYFDRWLNHMTNEYPRCGYTMSALGSTSLGAAIPGHHPLGDVPIP